MNTTDLWTALLSDDPDELAGALAAVASDEVSAEIARRDVFGADPDDDPFGRGELWPDGEGAGSGRASSRRPTTTSTTLRAAPVGWSAPTTSPSAPSAWAERAEAAGLDADGMSEVLASDSDWDGRFEWDIDYSDHDPDSDPDRRRRRDRDGIGY